MIKFQNSRQNNSEQNSESIEVTNREIWRGLIDWQVFHSPTPFYPFWSLRLRFFFFFLGVGWGGSVCLFKECSGSLYSFFLFFLGYYYLLEYFIIFFFFVVKGWFPFTCKDFIARSLEFSSLRRLGRVCCLFWEAFVDFFSPRVSKL